MGKSILLLVTLVLAGRPPSHYQDSFKSMEACEAERTRILRYVERRRQAEEQRRRDMLKDGVIVPAQRFPETSAVCMEQ